MVASNSILITPAVPYVSFYEKSPLYGIIYEKSLRNRTSLTNEEVSIIAEPFFFSIPNRDSSNLSYTWTLNGSPLPDFSGESLMTLRKAGGEAGRADLRVVLQNNMKLLQGASQNLTIFYE